MNRNFLCILTLIFNFSLSSTLKSSEQKDIENQKPAIASFEIEKSIETKEKKCNFDKKDKLHALHLGVISLTTVAMELGIRGFFDAYNDYHMLPEFFILLGLNISLYELIERYFYNQDYCIPPEKKCCNKFSYRKCCKGFTYVGRTVTVAIAATFLVETFILGGFGYWDGNTYGKDFAEDANEIESKRPFLNSNFSFTVMSDPQYEWFGAPQTNIDQAYALSMIKDSHNKRPIMNIINGDLTSYGHPNEVQHVFMNFYHHDKIGIASYFGLGNHDYENNIDSCWGALWSIFTSGKNWCANYMIKITKDFLAHKNNITSSDDGSLSYSWDKGDLHFVQLHNYLSYESSQINIKSGEDWLKEDLMKAKEGNKVVIINQHKPYSYELSKLLEENGIDNVCIVFAGHLHQIIGHYYSITNALYSNLPVYLSGSAEYNSTLLVEYDKFNRALNISSVATNTDPLEKTFLARFSCP